jgi:hypothetical protein
MICHNHTPGSMHRNFTSTLQKQPHPPGCFGEASQFLRRRKLALARVYPINVHFVFILYRK